MCFRRHPGPVVIVQSGCDGVGHRVGGDEVDAGLPGHMGDPCEDIQLQKCVLIRREQIPLYGSVF